jgi:hypothetical protein
MGRLDIVINNPPHVGLLAAIPVYMAEPDTSVIRGARGERSIGRDFIRANAERVFWLFTLGRWACIPFSIVGAVTCFAYGRALYGPAAGLMAATMWCFSPNILGHGQLVAHDVPAASLGVVATYAFWQWLQRPSWWTTAVAGLALGCALLTKMTMLIHLAVWPVVWCAWQFLDDRSSQSIKSIGRGGLKLIAIFVIAIDVVNVGYLFQGSFAPLDSYHFQSKVLAGSQQSSNRFEDSILGDLPVPLPGPFVAGMDFQRFVLEGGLPFQFSYLRGEWSTQGWPYYYLYAMAIKAPLGAWVLLMAAVAMRVGRLDGHNRSRDEMVLLAPAASLLLVASVSATWTDHLRHVLPCFPFAFIWISRIAEVQWSSHRWFAALRTAALVWFVASSLSVYPHSLSYFNESVGGPMNGPYHLLSSNIDYGQDLLKLARWAEQHQEARPLGLAYWDLDSVDPQIAGIEYFVAPSAPPPGSTTDGDRWGPQPGWYAVNVNLLHGDAWPGRTTYPDLGYYGYFLKFTPVARAGYSIYIYNISVEDANRVREELGLPRLGSDKANRTTTK